MFCKSNKNEILKSLLYTNIITNTNMAFIANLTEQEQKRLHDAIFNKISNVSNPNFSVDINTPPPPPSFTTLGPSINSTMQDAAFQRMDEMFREGVDGIIESPGTGSGFVYWRNDRHFFLRYNDLVYKVSTNHDLSEIYDVERQ